MMSEYMQNLSDNANALMTYSDVMTIISSDDRFLPFRAMFSHEPLLQFVYSEKCRFSGPFDESRVIVDPLGNEVGGYRVETVMPEDRFHPRYFQPFELKGLWLPIAKGTLFLSQYSDTSSDLIRWNVDTKEDEILFLIHPSSEVLYQDLIQQYSSTMISVSALSLSSLRTLLIACPQHDGQYKPLMVKISLDRASQGVSRVLTTRECALSVANSKILKKKIAARDDNGVNILPIDIVEDNLAYVPDGLDAGMLLRTLPDCLDPMKANEQGLYLIPLLSLYGIKNRDFLDQLILANGGMVTHFLTSILEPLVRSFVALLYDKQTSIEAHGQNLMLVLDRNHCLTGLMYRDMGGVNCWFSQEEWQSLPDNLQKKQWYYFDTHINDAAKAFEDHIVRRGLFPLTKQLCKNINAAQNDKQFLNWKQAHFKNNTLKNWTLYDVEQNTHATALLPVEFYRYGYVETLCADLWIKAMLAHGIISQTTQTTWYNSWQEFQRLADGDIVAPFTCHQHGFFYDTIVSTLNTRPSIVQLDDSNEISSNYAVLFDKIGELEQYGHDMIADNRKKPGVEAIQLANALHRVILTLKNGAISRLDAGKNIHTLINDGQKILGEDRKWKDILANILLACSVIGLVVMGVNYIYSGQFFFNTTRQTKLDAINNEWINHKTLF